MDSTGYGINKYESWFDVRTKKNKRKEFKKSHRIVGYWFKGILSHEVTPGHCHDSPIFSILIEKLPKSNYESISGDTAYCNRCNCNLVSENGMMPFFKPMKNATTKAKRSPAWHKMIRLWKDDKNAFDNAYHQRSVIEAVIGAEKQRLGHVLFSRREDLQEKELRLRAICYNLLVMNKIKASLILHEPLLLPVKEAG